MTSGIFHGAVLLTFLCAVFVERGSSGQQRCDAKQFSECFREAMSHIKFPDAIDDKSLAEDCKVSEPVNSCTKNKEIGGCSDELKQRLKHLKSDFASLRSFICDTNAHTSLVEWTHCLNLSVIASCPTLLRQDRCSTVQYNCFLNATTKCTRDSPAMKAMNLSVNTRFALDCSGVDWNSGITTSTKILLTLAALCISLFTLRK